MMVYLESEQIEALRKRARVERISVAELVRRLVRQSLAEPAGVPPIPGEVYARIVGLGSSGRAEIGDEHDRSLAEALRREHLR